LTNVARHAGVRQVTARVLASERTLRVQIIDQGAGFNLSDVLKTNHRRGLNGMRERASLLRGQVEIESTAGLGTQITAELPLATTTVERTI